MKWQAACADSNVEPPTVAHVEQKMKGTALPHTHLFIIDMGEKTGILLVPYRVSDPH